MINETVESKLPTELPLKFGHLEAYLILALRIRHNHAKTDIWPLNQLLLVYQQAVQASLAHSGGNGCRGVFILKGQLPGRLELQAHKLLRG